MTYNAIEQSIQSGAPIEVYEFSYNPTYYRYTSADADMVLNAITYAAKPITRSAIEATPEMARNSITITAPRDLPIADLYRIAPPSDVVTLKIMRYHETDAAAELITIWMGRVLNARWKGDSTVELLCEPVFTSLKRPGLRRLYQRACPHVLYSTACGASSTANKASGAVDTISANVITVGEAALHPDGFFSGGFISWPNSSGAFERRMILEHVGASLSLSAAAYDLAVSTIIDIYPGCDKTLATCDSRFSNSDNYGGFPWIPSKNPFGNDPIY